MPAKLDPSTPGQAFEGNVALDAVDVVLSDAGHTEAIAGEGVPKNAEGAFGTG